MDGRWNIFILFVFEPELMKNPGTKEGMGMPRIVSQRSKKRAWYFEVIYVWGTGKYVWPNLTTNHTPIIQIYAQLVLIFWLLAEAGVANDGLDFIQNTKSAAQINVRRSF